MCTASHTWAEAHVVFTGARAPYDLPQQQLGFAAYV
jgi:hypothetical protein